MKRDTTKVTIALLLLLIVVFALKNILTEQVTSTVTYPDFPQ